MKRVVEGQTYNTDTATLAARFEYEDMQDNEVTATLYLSRGGAFFLVHEWDVDGRAKFRVEPLSREELGRVITNTDNLEIMDEAIINAPPEAEDRAESEATLYVRMPTALKRRIDEASSSARLSANAWAMQCIERCLASPTARGDQSNNVARASFSEDQIANVVRGQIDVPASFTGTPFTIPMAKPLEEGLSHWDVKDQALRKLARYLEGYIFEQRSGG
jgi:hypothetical protein